MQESSHQAHKFDIGHIGHIGHILQIKKETRTNHCHDPQEQEEQARIAGPKVAECKSVRKHTFADRDGDCS